MFFIQVISLSDKQIRELLKGEALTLVLYDKTIGEESLIGHGLLIKDSLDADLNNPKILAAIERSNGQSDSFEEAFEKGHVVEAILFNEEIGDSEESGRAWVEPEPEQRTVS
jgi:hypothetical protein